MRYKSGNSNSARLLRQVPAITELVGSMRPATSKLVFRVLRSMSSGSPDVSRDPKFVQAMANRRYYGRSISGGNLNHT